MQLPWGCLCLCCVSNAAMRKQEIRGEEERGVGQGGSFWAADQQISHKVLSGQLMSHNTKLDILT